MADFPISDKDTHHRQSRPAVSCLFQTKKTLANIFIHIIA